MKTTRLFALLLALATVACNKENSFKSTEEVGPYTVSLIQKNVWHIEDCNSSNPSGYSVKEDGTSSMNNCSDMYIVRGRRKAILIDLSNNIQWADNAEESLREIFFSRAGKKEKIITITHNHFDHTGMLAAFARCEDVKFMLPEHDFPSDERFPVERTSLISDMQIIDLGGLSLQCVEVTGHTPGSMAFFLIGEDLAFTGDAIGSGGGVWIFSMEGFKQYVHGVKHLLEYIQAAGINKDKLIFWSGHMWQKLDLPELNIQYLMDMQTLIDQILAGTAYREDYNLSYLDSNFKYGIATITWNKADSEKLSNI